MIARRSVLDFSRRHLGSVHRRSGESYAEHCEEVANVFAEASDDASLFSVALLHDLPVHPDGKELLSAAPLTDRERELVLQMYALRRLHIGEKTEDLDMVIDAFMEQPELLPLRMAHRVNDVRNITRFHTALRKQIAKETLHMYAAIAGRLGMQQWRIELEDQSFPIVQPKIAKDLCDQFAHMRRLDMVCMKQAQEYLQKEFSARGVPAEIQTRLKGLYSTYRKMVLKNRTFDQLTDRLALRILVEKPEECYIALGIVHEVFRPIAGKLKDYIGAPKENGYRSIHTVVYPLPGVSAQPMEIQVRTATMHKECLYGNPAHGEYKESMYALSRKPARVNLFRNLQSLREESKTPQQFEDALRMYFREDHIAVFDDKNNLFHIKQPATALDFVCLVHPKKFRRLREVRINGRRRTMDTRLNDGDTVECAFSREKRTRKDWIDACMHTATRKLLKNELHKEKV